MSDEFAETLEDTPVKLPHPAPKTFIEYKGSTQYEAFTLAIYSSSRPVALLGLDTDRVRAMIVASVPDVFIGKMSVLASYNGQQPVGFSLPVGFPVELQTISEMYVAYTPNPDVATPAYVSVFVERSVTKND